MKQNHHKVFYLKTNNRIEHNKFCTPFPIICFVCSKFGVILPVITWFFYCILSRENLSVGNTGNVNNFARVWWFGMWGHQSVENREKWYSQARWKHHWKWKSSFLPSACNKAFSVKTLFRRYFSVEWHLLRIHQWISSTPLSKCIQFSWIIEFPFNLKGLAVKPMRNPANLVCAFLCVNVSVSWNASRCFWTLYFANYF